MIEWEEHKEKCCVVVPVYKRNPVFFEQASLIQCVRVFGEKRDIIIVAPSELDISGYIALCPNFKFKVKRFAPQFFESLEGYNQLCKRWEFYSSFTDYEYMLVYQLDCWAFSDNVDYFVDLGYDYYGAPWLTIQDNQIKAIKCGNGGFSLRKIEKFINVCKTIETQDIEDTTINEDVFFCEKRGNEFNLCPVEIARTFSFEVGPTLFFKLNKNKLPMGCHKPFLFQFTDFWKDYIRF